MKEEREERTETDVDPTAWMSVPWIDRLVGVLSDGDRPLRPVTYLVAILLVFTSTLTFRFVNLGADPVPWFTAETGYHIDEGYKTLSPRNLALFGATHWHPADEYPGWMTGSAVTQWPYYWSFQTLGTTLSSARTVTILFGAILLGAAVVFLWKRRSPQAAALGVVVLSLDPGLFFFSRSALFETALAVFTYLPLFLLAWAVDALSKRKWVILGPAILLVFGVPAFFFLKASIVLYLGPIAAAFVLWAIGRGTQMSVRLALAGTAVVSAGLVLWFLLTFTPALVQKLDLAAVARAPQQILLNPTHTLSPVAFLLAQIALIDLLVRDPRTVFGDLYRLSLAALVVLAPIALALFGSNPARYHLPIVPAALLLVVDRLSMAVPPRSVEHRPAWKSPHLLAVALVFASAAMTLWASIEYYVLQNLPFALGEDPGLSEVTVLSTYPLFLLVLAAAVLGVVAVRVRRHRRDSGTDATSWGIAGTSIRRLVLVLAAVHVAVGGAMVGAGTLSPTYRSHEIADRMRRIAGTDGTVGGDWAPFFAANTELRVLYTRPDWNSPEDFQELRLQYFLDSDSYYDRNVIAGLEAMDAVSLGDPIFLGTYHGHSISLRPITYSDPFRGSPTD